MKALLGVVGLVGVASGCNLVTNFIINGAPSSDCVRQAVSAEPITDMSSDNMACNIVKGNAKSKCAVKGGDQIGFEWRPDPNNPSNVTDDSHGPCSIYLKKVDDASTATGPGPDWFKLSHDSVDSAGVFCTDRLRRLNASQPGVIPNNIPPGDYLIRAEIAALNDAAPANVSGGAEPQFYTSCVQITVQGTSGDLNAIEKVSIPGYINETTPGVLFDIRNSTSFRNYPMFGPAPLSSVPNPSGSPLPPARTTMMTVTTPLASPSATPLPHPESDGTEDETDSDDGETDPDDSEADWEDAETDSDDTETDDESDSSLDRRSARPAGTTTCTSTSAPPKTTLRANNTQSLTPSPTGNTSQLPSDDAEIDSEDAGADQEDAETSDESDSSLDRRAAPSHSGTTSCTSTKPAPPKTNISAKNTQTPTPFPTGRTAPPPSEDVETDSEDAETGQDDTETDDESGSGLDRRSAPPSGTTTCTSNKPSPPKTTLPTKNTQTPTPFPTGRTAPPPSGADETDQDDTETDDESGSDLDRRSAPHSGTTSCTSNKPAPPKTTPLVKNTQTPTPFPTGATAPPPTGANETDQDDTETSDESDSSLDRRAAPSHSGTSCTSTMPAPPKTTLAVKNTQTPAPLPTGHSSTSSDDGDDENNNETEQEDGETDQDDEETSDESDSSLDRRDAPSHSGTTPCTSTKPRNAPRAHNNQTPTPFPTGKTAPPPSEYADLEADEESDSGLDRRSAPPPTGTAPVPPKTAKGSATPSPSGRRERRPRPTPSGAPHDPPTETDRDGTETEQDDNETEQDHSETDSEDTKTGDCTGRWRWKRSHCDN